jgi:hypothetical protein
MTAHDVPQSATIGIDGLAFLQSVLPPKGVYFLASVVLRDCGQRYTALLAGAKQPVERHATTVGAIASGLLSASVIYAAELREQLRPVIDAAERAQ